MWAWFHVKPNLWLREPGFSWSLTFDYMSLVSCEAQPLTMWAWFHVKPNLWLCEPGFMWSPTFDCEPGFMWNPTFDCEPGFTWSPTFDYVSLVSREAQPLTMWAWFHVKPNLWLCEPGFTWSLTFDYVSLVSVPREAARRAWHPPTAHQQRYHRHGRSQGSRHVSSVPYTQVTFLCSFLNCSFLTLSIEHNITI